MYTAHSITDVFIDEVRLNRQIDTLFLTPISVHLGSGPLKSKVPMEEPHITQASKDHCIYHPCMVSSFFEP